MADTRRDKRAPVSLKVRFKSATLDEFVEQYSADISRGGLFIKSKKPMKIGTLLKFELQLKDESRLIHGVGRVVWRREADEATDNAPAGMGIKFIKMGSDSRTLVQSIVEDRGDAPGTFDEGADGPKKEASFFPDSGPAELPAPEDRTQVRHASEFLAEALSDSDGAAAEAAESAEAARKRTEEIQKERAEAEERRKAEEAAAAARIREQEEAAAAAKAAEAEAEEAEEAESEEAAETKADEGDEESAAAATVPDESTQAAAADTVPADESPAKKEAPKKDDQKKAVATQRAPAPAEESGPPWVMILLALLIAGGVGGYFWWSGQQDSGEETEVGTEPEVEEPEVEEPEVEEPEELEAVTVDVHIESNVPAEITANGESLGTTPLDVPLTVGEAVTLIATAAGHGPVEQTITPAEEPEPVTFELAPISYVVVVQTTPDLARVTVAGNHAQSPARFELEEVPRGPVTVAVSKPGFRMQTTTVTADMFTEQDGAMIATVQVELLAREAPTAMTATMMAATMETAMETETAMEATMQATMEAAMEAAPMEAAPMEAAPMEAATMATPPDNPF